MNYQWKILISASRFKLVCCSFFVSLVCLLSITDDVGGYDKPDVVTIATWNLEWFFDNYKYDNRTDLSKKLSAPSREEWEWKLKSVAEVISKLKPTIFCLQEVENRDGVYKLTKQLEQEHGIKYRYAFITGYDFGTDQDVAILYQDGLVEFSRREQTRKMYESKDYYNLSKHLFARFEWGEGGEKESLMILNVHLRAKPEKQDIRIRQARLMRHWINDEIKAGGNVIVIGDLNTEDDYGSESTGGEMAILRGLNTSDETDDLHDAHAVLDNDIRTTHILGRQYDRILFSEALKQDDPNRKDLVFNRAVVRRDLVVQGEIDENHWDDYYGMPQGERDLSDHYPLMAEFVFK